MKSIVTIFISLIFHSAVVAQNIEANIHLRDSKTLKTDYIRFSNGAIFGSPFVATDQLGLDRLYAEEIDYVETFIQNGKSRRYEVIPWRTFRFWTQVEKVSERISIFNSAINNQFYMEPIAYSTITEQNIIAYRKDNGSAKRINYRNLKSDLNDNIESKSYLNRARNQTLLQLASYVAGTALIGLGVKQTYDQALGEIPINIGRITALYLVGITGFVIPVIIRPYKIGNYFKALKAY
ncbi:hypothetical protein ABWH96_11320 [Marivirga tractuosa]|uniref:hypothetical protein n=1 Tax=Marivirga tractuosa TaxID=1006 RepID=UPI0035CF6532